MKPIEITILAILLLGGFGALFLPNTKALTQVIHKKELLYEANKDGRYISTDEVAQAIIEKDPSYIFIDLRSPKEYAKFTIEGAINIPSDEILKEKNLDYFDQEIYTTVLFSNGSSKADLAWTRLRSFDFQGNRVMKGGLNEWYTTIINPQKPKDSESSQAQDLYLFRKGASYYFTSN